MLEYISRRTYVKKTYHTVWKLLHRNIACEYNYLYVKSYFVSAILENTENVTNGNNSRG